MSNIRGISIRIASACRLPVAAAIVATALGAQSASAANIVYTGTSFIGDHVDITQPNNVSGGAGQITLEHVNGTSNTILAWCLDVFHFLQSSGGTYAQGPQLPNSQPDHTKGQNDSRIGGLMLEGNSYIAQAQAAGNKLTINGVQYNTADISAATQIAIWSVEYAYLGPLHDLEYSVNSTASSANFTSLV